MGKPRLDDSGTEIRRNSYAMRGASSQEDALTHVFYLRKITKLKQQKSPKEQYELSIRKFKGNPSNDTFKLERDPTTKRNSLIDTTHTSTSISFEERASYTNAIQNIQSSNPKFNLDTCYKMVADMNKITVTTLKRWLGE